MAPAGERREADQAQGCHREAHGASGVGDASHPRRARALRRHRRPGDRGPAHPARRGSHRAGAHQGSRAGAAAASLRARGAEPALAVGHLHLPAPQAGAHLRRGVPRRPLAVPRVLRARAPPEERPGHGGAAPRHRRVWGAARDTDRPGAAVHDVEGPDGVRARAAAREHRAREVAAAAPADARQD